MTCKKDEHLFAHWNRGGYGCVLINFRKPNDAIILRESCRALAAAGIAIATMLAASSRNHLGFTIMNLKETMESALLRRTTPPEMSELSLVLPSWQMRELANVADSRGMTVGQLLRGFIQQVVQPFPKITDN